MSTLTNSFYLVISSRGTSRTTKHPPALCFDEVAVRLSITVPMKLFERPLIQATVKISEDAIAPKEIAPEVLISTAQLIEQQTGMRVELKLIRPEEE